MQPITNEWTTERRYIRVPIDMVIFTEWLTEGWTIGKDGFVTCYEGLPKGARLVNFGYDPLSGCEQLIFEHESFAPVRHGEIIPALYVAYQIQSKDWVGIEVSADAANSQ